MLRLRVCGNLWSVWTKEKEQLSKTRCFLPDCSPAGQLSSQQQWQEQMRATALQMQQAHPNQLQLSSCHFSRCRRSSGAPHALHKQQDSQLLNCWYEMIIICVYRHWRYSEAGLAKARSDLNATAVQRVRSMLQEEKEVVS
jgi:hypothetical protein